MIDVYFWPTPNGYKITIALEELSLPYRVVPVDIGKGEQFKPEFLNISRNNRMPAIVDSDGAILLYLAEKTGRLMPTDPRGRYQTLEWLMFQMASVGPMLGQAHHFRRYAPEPIQYAIDRHTNEARRIYGVIDKQLSALPYLVREYSIVDIATYPWLRPHRWQGQDLADFPNLKRWYEAIKSRPAVQHGLAPLAEKVKREAPKGEEWGIMFGRKQYERR
jgi:GST-like protein